MFGQLGTFVNHMKHLGLGHRTCLLFLQKQSVIGNLSKEHYGMLKLQVEAPLMAKSVSNEVIVHTE